MPRELTLGQWACLDPQEKGDLRRGRSRTVCSWCNPSGLYQVVFKSCSLKELGSGLGLGWDRAVNSCLGTVYFPRIQAVFQDSA